eukprot:3870049-Rhodomonas_salina.1
MSVSEAGISGAAPRSRQARHANQRPGAQVRENGRMLAWVSRGIGGRNREWVRRRGARERDEAGG